MLTREKIIVLGAGVYCFPRQLPNGIWCCIGQQFVTWSLIYNITESGYDYRYCYEHRADAVLALAAWDGEGDPSGPWIKRKGADDDLLNPEWAQSEQGDA